MSNATRPTRPNLLYAFCLRAKDHHSGPNYPPRLKKTLR